MFGKLKLRGRLFLMGMIPCLGTAFFAGRDLQTSLRLHERMAQLQQLVDIAAVTDELMIELRAERGLSVAWVGAQRDRLRGELASVQDRVDAALLSWERAMGSRGAANADLDDRVRVRARLQTLSVLRSRVERQELDARLVAAAYTRSVGWLIEFQGDVCGRVQTMGGDEGLPHLAALSLRLTWLVEALGRQRAELTRMASATELGVADALAIEASIAAVAAADSVARGNRNESDHVGIDSLFKGAAVDASENLVRGFLTAALAGGRSPADVEAVWRATTARIDLAVPVHAAISHEMRELAGSVRGDAASDVWVSGSLALVILLCTLVPPMLFAASTARRIQRVVTFADGLANGDMRGRLNPAGGDETDHLMRTLNQMAAQLTGMIETVKGSTRNVGANVNTIRSVTTDLQSTIVEQQASTTEIVATTTEIAATARELATGVRQVTAIVNATSEAAQTGMVGLNDLTATVQSLADGSQQLVDRLSELNDRASRITSVTALIGKVADQTNMLSLNAAIEAEKAGEFGSGFSVVATEIRRLADRTAVAVLDIETIVKEIQSAVSSSVMTMDRFRQHVHAGVARAGDASRELHDVIQQVAELGPRFVEVSSCVETQAAAAEQIHSAMVELDQSASQMRSVMEQTRSLSDSLSTAVGELTSETRQFRTGGSDAS